MIELKEGDWVEVAEGVFIQLAVVRGKRARLCFDAPKSVKVKRLNRGKE